MTDPLAEQDDASIPLSPEEREGLIPSYIALRGELNEAEQANILEDDAWAFARKREVLDEGFLNTLYKRMSGNVMRARRQSAPSSRVLLRTLNSSCIAEHSQDLRKARASRSAQLDQEEIEETEHDGHLAQQRQVHLARGTAHDSVNLRVQLATKLGRLSAKLPREAVDLAAKLAAKLDAERVDSLLEHQDIVLRRKRVLGSRDFDLDGAHDCPRLRRCDAGLLQ